MKFLFIDCSLLYRIIYYIFLQSSETLYKLAILEAARDQISLIGKIAILGSRIKLFAHTVFQCSPCRIVFQTEISSSSFICIFHTLHPSFDVCLIPSLHYGNYKNQFSRLYFDFVISTLLIQVSNRPGTPQFTVCRCNLILEF